MRRRRPGTSRWRTRRRGYYFFAFLAFLRFVVFFFFAAFFRFGAFFRFAAFRFLVATLDPPDGGSTASDVI